MLSSHPSEPPASTSGSWGRALKALNQPISLLLIGSALFGSLSWLLEARRECLVQGRNFEELNSTLTTEIVERSLVILESLHLGEPAEKLSSLRGPGAPHTFREHAGQSLAALIDTQEFLYNRIEGQHDAAKGDSDEWVSYLGMRSGVALNPDLKALKNAILHRTARTTDAENDRLQRLLAEWSFGRPVTVRPMGGCGMRMLVHRSFAL